MMIKEDIRKDLLKLQDEKYKDFQSKLIPSRNNEDFIGVRTPELRKLAKSVGKREDVGSFLEDLPHTYFDEDQLHAFIISDIKDFDECIGAVEAFLPFVDNWGTCDQMSPGIFKTHKKELSISIRKWVASEHSYTVRFGIKMLMEHFLDEDFDKKYPTMVAKVRSDEYYVKMMQAWYFATALAKQYEATLPYIEKQKLDMWTHNKTIQKSVESYRITPSQKKYLKSLKIK